MKYDEFAFFNQQLALMLRDGVPLEGAMRQLSANMRNGELRAELELLEADLKNGTPLKQALAARKLPEFYTQMIEVGVASNDLPGVLLMLADYYRRMDSTWTRLKGLMVYPMIVLVAAFGLSCFLTVASTQIFTSVFQEAMGVVLPPALLVVFVPALQRSLRWRVPAFKEARLAQVASAMGMILKSGGNLSDALGLVTKMEQGTVASRELSQWHSQLTHGHGQFSEMAAPGRAFPPLFLWLVTNAGEDLAGGFRRAGQSSHRNVFVRSVAVFDSGVGSHDCIPGLSFVAKFCAAFERCWFDVIQTAKAMLIDFDSAFF
jgi:type II secretory pathway component PulF